MRRTLVGFVFALSILTGVARLGAADPPSELKLVPADAAVFAHADFERIWKSKVGDTFRKVNARDIEQGLKKLKEISGLTPDDVKTVTFYIPRVKQDGEPPIVLMVRTKKPLDRAGIVKALKGSLGKDDSFEELPGNKYLLEKRVLVDLGDPTSFRLFTQYQKDQKEVAAADGPIAPAIQAAANGTPSVLGVAFANLPDEIRQENIPSEVRPFQPFFFTDAAILTGDFDKDNLVLTARFKAPTRARAVEAEKSLGALKTLIDTGLAFGLLELEKNKEKDGSDKKLIEFVKAIREGVKASKITHEDNTPAATLTLKADTDYSPFLEFLFGKVSGAAARSRDQNNLKQIGLAMHNYADVYQGGFPSAALVGRKGKPLLSWRVMILPFVEQDTLYKKFKLDEPWDSIHNKKVVDDHPMPPVFALPGVSKPNDKVTHYQVFFGNGALFDPIQTSKFGDIRDGTSTTVMVATAKKAVPWTKPDDLEFDPKKDPRELLLFLNGMCNVSFADGSVRAMSEKAKVEIWQAVITKAGGEVVGPNDF